MTISKAIEIDAIRFSIEVLSHSDNAQDLCRRLAHADFMDGFCYGVAVYLLDNRSVLVDVARYGRSHDFGVGEISAWDDTVLSKAIRSRKITVETTEDSTLYALPIQVSGLTTGVFIFNLSKEVPNPVFSKEVTQMLSSLGGLFMDGKGLSLRAKPQNSGSRPTPEGESIQELTTRQMTVLHLMADGLTNAEIAKIVLLSESTVRQETIRVFRILNCHTRAEAIVKGRSIGILAKVHATTQRSKS